MSSIARRSFSKLMKIISRTAAPLPLSGEARIYVYTDQFNVMTGDGYAVPTTGPLATLPKGYIDGLEIEWNSGILINYGTGYCRSADDSFNIYISASSTINVSQVGVVNGLDAGAIVANTWYAVYVIADSLGLNPAGGLISANFTTPTLPTGYDKFRRIGCVNNTAATAFSRFFQRKTTSRTRRYYYDILQAMALNAGQATAFTSVDLSRYMPSTARSAVLEWRFAVGTAGALATDIGYLRVAGGASADGPFRERRGYTLNNTTEEMQLEVPAPTQAIEYKVTQGGANQNTATIRVMGFDDEI